MGKKDEVDVSDLMAFVEANKQDTQALLQKWDELKKLAEPIANQIIILATREMYLRKVIVDQAFIAGETDLMKVEGTNYKDLNAGWRLKGVLKIDRKVDEAAWPAVEEALQKLLVHTSDLIRRKPELKVKEYKELTEEQRKIMDQALDITLGTPNLELVPPKV